jgi:uncharacterized phage protein (TIGR01671 family)
MTMREILFRGKRKHDGGWVIGDGIHYPKSVNFKGTCWIDGRREKANDWVQIVPDTIGQFTGLTDKFGRKIFEGDIIRVEVAKIDWVAVCKFYGGAFGLVWNFGAAERWQAFTGICNAEYEIIGNVHDNPELMEDE